MRTTQPLQGIDLDELLRLLPQPLGWERFKRETILPMFSTSLVSPQYRRKIIRIIEEIESLDLADDGEPLRRIESTADLNLTLVSRYIASRPSTWSPFTLKDRLTVIQQICSVAVQLRYLPVSPFTLRPIRKIVRVGKPRNKRALSRDEMRRLFEVLRSDVAERRGWEAWRARRLLAAVAIAAHTGIRRNELLTLHVEDLDLEARVIRLQARGPRGMGLKSEGSGKPVGMPVALIPMVRSWLERRLDAPPGFPIDRGCPFVIPNVRRTGPWLSGRVELTPLGRLKAAGRRAGIPDVNWHMLRRTLATHMEVFGASEASIQRQLRHSDPETTREHYRRADEANIADVMRDVEF